MPTEMQLMSRSKTDATPVFIKLNTYKHMSVFYSEGTAKATLLKHTFNHLEHTFSWLKEQFDLIGKYANSLS